MENIKRYKKLFEDDITINVETVNVGSIGEVETETDEIENDVFDETEDFENEDFSGTEEENLFFNNVYESLKKSKKTKKD